MRGGHPGEDGCCEWQGVPLTKQIPKQNPKQTLARRAGLVEVGRSFKDVVIQDIPGRGEGEARRGGGGGKGQALPKGKAPSWFEGGGGAGGGGGNQQALSGGSTDLHVSSSSYDMRFSDIPSAVSKDSKDEAHELDLSHLPPPPPAPTPKTAGARARSSCLPLPTLPNLGRNQRTGHIVRGSEEEGGSDPSCLPLPTLIKLPTLGLNLTGVAKSKAFRAAAAAAAAVTNTRGGACGKGRGAGGAGGLGGAKGGGRKGVSEDSGDGDVIQKGDVVCQGSFLIDQKIGTGGFGTVFLATLLPGGRRCALKMQRPGKKLSQVMCC